MTDYTSQKADSGTGPLLLDVQQPAPERIKSIQLYREGNIGTPPIISLERGEQLLLRFDELADVSGSYEVRFSHHQRDWKESNIPEHWFIEGINRFAILGGEPGQFSNPGYFSYSFAFPNREIRFLISGNYMIHIHDYETKEELFSLPFFVSENSGNLIQSTETLFNAASGNGTSDQLFSEYQYPDEVQFPQFDLYNGFVRNRFWASFRLAENKFSSGNGRIRFHTSRSASFDAEFDFLSLDLNELRPDGRRIIDWQPAQNPPRIVLKEDRLNFSAHPRRIYSSETGAPSSARNARYVETVFQLDASGKPDSTVFYLAGDFNQWLPSEDSELRYNKESGLREVRVLLKQGSYQYKYFEEAPSGELSPIPVNDAISKIQQEYISFIYFRDPDRNYDRLLKSAVFYSGD